MGEGDVGGGSILWGAWLLMFNGKSGAGFSEKSKERFGSAGMSSRSLFPLRDGGRRGVFALLPWLSKFAWHQLKVSNISSVSAT